MNKIKLIDQYLSDLIFTLLLPLHSKVIRNKKLKSLFDNKKYAKVDLKKIRMTSIDMNNLGSVKLEIFIPFKRVKNPCEARTGFDHSGGWDHDPEIEIRKQQLLGIAVCKKLEISPLIKTPENFQEYWIQWKHKDFQANCACN